MGLTLVCGSCKSTVREEKYYEKQEKKLAKQEEKDYNARVKAHQDMQSPQTLKMMHDAERRSRKLNKSRER